MVKALRVANDVLFIVVIVILAVYFILKFTDKIAIYEVKTGSMEEGIHVGDYIVTLTCNSYEVGDVVTYKVGKYFVTHRIIKMDGNVIITKGDANNIEDERINISDIKGKVILTGGILNIAINYRFVIIAVMILMYLVSCYLESLNEENVKIQKKSILRKK